MKQKLIKSLALIASISCLTLGMAGCGSKKKEKKNQETVSTTTQKQSVKQTQKQAEKTEVVTESSTKTKQVKTVTGNTAKTDKVKTDKTKTKKKVYTIGETAKNKNVSITLTDYKTNNGNEYYKPEKGNQFLLTEFEVKNTSDKELNVSSIMSFTGSSDDGSLKNNLLAILTTDDEQMDVTIQPGKKAKGWIGWEVSKDFSNAEIKYMPNVIEEDKFFTFEITNNK